MVSDSCLLGAHPHGCAPSQYPVLKVPAAARPRGAARQGDILPHPHGCAPSQYPVLKVPAAARPRGAARQGDILPDRGRAGGGDPGLHGMHTFEGLCLFTTTIYCVRITPIDNIRPVTVSKFTLPHPTNPKSQEQYSVRQIQLGGPNARMTGQHEQELGHMQDGSCRHFDNRPANMHF